MKLDEAEDGDEGEGADDAASNDAGADVPGHGGHGGLAAPMVLAMEEEVGGMKTVVGSEDAIVVRVGVVLGDVGGVIGTSIWRH
jgi:hypothetical protein